MSTTLKTIHLGVYDVLPTNKVSVLIQQLATGFCLDASDGVFKASSAAASPYVALKAGGAGTPASRTAGLDQTIDPSKGWSDGRYAATYYDMGGATPRPFDEETFVVAGGDSRPTSTTDIALRIMNCSSGNTTVRDQLSKIDAIYRWVSKQPGFSA